MPHGLQPLPLPAAERGRLPVEAEITEADRLDPLQRRHGRPRNGSGDRVVDLLQYGDQVRDLHARAVGDRPAVDPGRERRRVEPCSPAGRADALRQELPDQVTGLLAHGRQVPLQVQPLEAVGEALVLGGPGAAAAVDGDLAAGPPAHQELPFGGGEPPHRLVRVEVGAVGVRLALPRPCGERREADRPVGERALRVQDAVPVGPYRPAQAVAVGAHARRVVERVRRGRPGARGAVPGEQDADHRVDVRHGADRRPGVAADRPLVDDDRGGEVLQAVRVRPLELGQPVADEPRIRLVQLALRLHRDRVEDDRRLPRPRNAGEHGEPAFRDAEGDVLEVVLAGSGQGDEFGHAADARRNTRQPLA